MDILLDTHAAMWFFEGNPKMPILAREDICNLENMIYVSIASLWELAIKLNTGKLEFDGGLDGFMDAIDKNEFALLEVDPEHIKATMNLPLIHRDPFDRMIIAQAMVEDMAIMTIDENILKYDIESVW